MKMLKKISLATLFSLGVIAIIMPSVHAAKLAPFPNDKTLQPMPSQDVHPNISGNVNSTGIGTANKGNGQENTLLSESEKTATEERAGTLQDNPESNSRRWNYWPVYTGLALGIVGLAIYFSKKRNAPTA